MASLSTSPLVTTYTLEEFWDLPDPPDRSKLELIAGVLYMTPPPEAEHDDVVRRLNRLLTKYLLEHGDTRGLYLPRAAIWTGPNTHLEPDLFYVSPELQARLGPKRRDSADLVIEVIFPGSAVYDRNTKADTYRALGVRELWLIDDSRETIEVRIWSEKGVESATIFTKGQKIRSAVFPDLDLLIDGLFQD
jgi:Uma2 family endonuclease